MHYPVTRSVIFASIVLSSAEIWMRLVVMDANPGIAYNDIQLPYFLVDAHSVWMYPWTIVTAAFCGRRPLLTIIHICFLAVALHFFERAWGSRSLAKYVLLASIVPVLAATVMDLIFNLNGPIGGTVPLVIAFLVALKQANPFTYKLLGLEIKPRYLVMPVLMFYTLFVYFDFSVLVMAWVSLGVCWWYLRYIKSLVMDQLLDGPQIQKGDQSDSFAFATFFYPQPLTQAVDRLATVVHDTVGKKLIKKRLAVSDADRQRARGEQLLGH